MKAQADAEEEEKDEHEEDKKTCEEREIAVRKSRRGTIKEVIRGDSVVRSRILLLSTPFLVEPSFSVWRKETNGCGLQDES